MSQGLALGDCYCGWTKIYRFLSYPKLQTAHYNENGKQIYTSRVTICFFLTLILCAIIFSLRSIIPMFTGYIVETQFERTFMSNSLGYQGNKTLNEE